MSDYNFYKDSTKPPARRGFLSYFVTGISGALVGGMLVLTFAPGALLGKVVPQDNTSKASQGQQQEKQEEQTVLPEKNDAPTALAIAKKAIPSVVGIRTTKFKKSMLFKNEKVDGAGSGIIVDAKGYIHPSSKLYPWLKYHLLTIFYSSVRINIDVKYL